MSTENNQPMKDGPAEKFRSGNSFVDFVRKHELDIEKLTDKQLRQAIAAGEFQRNVMNEGGTNEQAVIYLQYREVSRLRETNAELTAALEAAKDALDCAASVMGSHELQDSQWDGARDCVKIARAVAARCLSISRF